MNNGVAAVPVNAQAALLAVIKEAVEKLLPLAPLNVLLLGEFPQPLVTTLQARGYRLTTVRWRDPSQQQPAVGANRELLQISLSSPDTDGQHFDAVLALDFAADIHPLAFFDQLSDVLTPQGLALLAGGQTPRTAWMVYLKALAARCGFEVVPSFGDAGTEGVSGPVTVLRRSATPPRWRVGHVQATDFAELSTLFQEVFGHPMSRALWDWKYAQGRGNAVMVRKDGEVVAHYGGMYRNILRCGEPDRVAQIGDVMVKSQERGVLTRNGPFFLTGTSWPEVYGPRGFGFPNARAMRVAEKMGLYTKAGQLAQVRWSPSEPRLRLGSRVRSLTRGKPADGAVVAALWAAMAHDLQGSVVGVRDWAYLEQRYFRHPHNHYQLVLVTARFSGKPLGVVVLQRLEGVCELMDVIAPLANFERVIDQARRLTGRWGLASMFCWITTEHLPLLLACGGSEEALNVMIPASSWTDDPQSELFVGKWWLMSGDTDFR